MHTKRSLMKDLAAMGIRRADRVFAAAAPLLRADPDLFTPT